MKNKRDQEMIDQIIDNIETIESNINLIFETSQDELGEMKEDTMRKLKI